MTILQTLLSIYLFIADARNRGGNQMRKRPPRSSAPPLSPEQRGQNTLKGDDLLVRALFLPLSRGIRGGRLLYSVLAHDEGEIGLAEADDGDKEEDDADEDEQVEGG